MGDPVADVAAATWAAFQYNQQTIKAMRDICQAVADGKPLTAAEAKHCVAELNALLETGGTILQTVELFLNGHDSNDGSQV